LGDRQALGWRLGTLTLPENRGHALRDLLELVVGECDGQVHFGGLQARRRIVSKNNPLMHQLPEAIRIYTEERGYPESRTYHHAGDPLGITPQTAMSHYAAANLKMRRIEWEANR